MTYKFFFLLLFIYGICVSSIAQTTLSGVIVDSNSHSVLSFVNVVIKQKSIGTISLADGTFSINIPSQNENDTLTFTMIGYSELSLSIKDIIATNQNTFQLKIKTNEMNSVTITAKIPLVVYKADRVIFNVENSIAATGGDAMDAIKRAPGVLVTGNEIMIAGKNSVAVMINGRLQQLSGDDLNQMLHSIPSDNISKIEIITSPSSKYDAQGNAGIINLILKKNRQQGFNGSITTAYEYNQPLKFSTASTSLNYKKNNLNLFFNANGGVQGRNYTAYTNTYYPNQYWHQDVKYPYINRFTRLQLGGDYSLTKKSTIGFMVNEAFNWLDNNESIVASSYDLNNNLDSTITTNGKTTDKYLGKLTTNLNYEYRFDTTGKKMNVDIDYYRQKANKHRDFTVENEIPTSSFINQTTSRMTGSPLTEIISAKVDFEIPLKEIKLNFGMKASDSKNDLNNLYETKYGNDYVNDTSKSNQFTYHEEIQAAYINTNKTFKKFEVSVGLRFEHTRGEGISVTALQKNSVDYTKLFPSGVVQYKLSENHIFSLSFAKRINRPSYNSLNPFRFYYTPTTFEQGNPTLQPSLSYLADLGYIYKANLNIKLRYNYASNYYDSRVSFIDTLHKTNTLTMKNIGDKQYANLIISGSLEPQKWWELVGEISGGFSQFVPFDKSGKSEYTGFYWYAEATNYFYLNKKKTLTAEISGSYYSPRQRDFVYWDAMSSVNVGLRYSMFNKKLIVAFYGEDLFAKSYRLQTNKLNNTVEYSYNGHPYRISLLYKFGNNNIRAKQLKSLEEIQRAN